MKNQAKGYNQDKVTGRLPQINDKSYLQNRGAAILAAGARRNIENIPNNHQPSYMQGRNENQRALHDVYGSNNANRYNHNINNNAYNKPSVASKEYLYQKYNYRNGL